MHVFVPYQVNGTSLLGATHLEAVRSLRGIGDNLSLLVCDGFDPADVPAGQHAAWQASPVATINTAKSQSQESLERDIPSNERAYEDIRKEIKRQVGTRNFLFSFVHLGTRHLAEKVDFSNGRPAQNERGRVFPKPVILLMRILLRSQLPLALVFPLCEKSEVYSFLVVKMSK